MNKLFPTATLAALALSTGMAFADSTALDTYWSNSANFDPDVYGMIVDTDANTIRDETSFATMWADATPEAQDKFRQACDEWQKEKTHFLDTVQARCKMATGPNG